MALPEFINSDDFCGVVEPTQSINHDRFDRGPNTFDAEDDKMKGKLWICFSAKYKAPTQVVWGVGRCGVWWDGVE